jgi:predicted RNA-binding protein with PIN domain
MSAGILLIDGYNLLHAAGMAQSHYRPGDLLRCRTRLLRFLLSKLSPAEIQGTTVIFDARDPPPDRPAQVVVSGMRVLFANPGGDADVLIQTWLARHPSPRRVTLVSSDRVLQRAARSCGSKFIGSEDFVRELAGRNAGRTPKGKKAPPDEETKPDARATEEQTDYWLKIFGDIPLDEPGSEDESAASVESPQRKQRKTEPPASRRAKQRSPAPDAQEDSKRKGTIDSDELAYWMNVFGGQSAAGSAPASPDELRLADLETWLKKLEATEGNATKKRGSAGGSESGNS